jgi:hypothetical protein
MRWLDTASCYRVELIQKRFEPQHSKEKPHSKKDLLELVLALLV